MGAGGANGCGVRCVGVLISRYFFCAELAAWRGRGHVANRRMGDRAGMRSQALTGEPRADTKAAAKSRIVGACSGRLSSAPHTRLGHRCKIVFFHI